jgi:hypothetical protein
MSDDQIGQVPQPLPADAGQPDGRAFGVGGHRVGCGVGILTDSGRRGRSFDRCPGRRIRDQAFAVPLGGGNLLVRRPCGRGPDRLALRRHGFERIEQRI